MPPPLSKEKVAEIIEMLKDKTRSHADIARTAEVNPVTVARIKRKFEDPSYDPSLKNTKVLNDKDIPEISREIMAKHRIDFTERSKRLLQERFD
jgi:transposase-like protein